MCAPQDSAGVITAQSNAKRQAEPPILYVTIQPIIFAAHWLGPSLVVI